jgi:hypothetical protein
MKERGMLFSKPMVLALLDGSKTQTRRIVKPQPIWLPEVRGAELIGPFMWPRGALGQQCGEPITKLPYGMPGDRLWVRETWQGPILECDEHFDQWLESPDMFKKPGFCVYRATDTLDAIDDDGKELGWRPSIHMPRWASRILLEITGLRAERLQDISEADAKAEGCEQYDVSGLTEAELSLLDAPLMERDNLYRNGYALLWESLAGPGSWDANPWCWVVEFRKVKP